MFNIIKAVMGALRRMLKKDDIKKMLDADIAISEQMLGKIEQWGRMLSGNADWVDNDSVFSLRLEQAVAREFANVSLNEMTINITNEGLKGIFDESIKDLNENLQKGLSFGAMIIKPLGKSGVQYVPQNAFIPVEYDARGRLIKVIFPEIKKAGESSFYIRLEYHSLDENGLTIINKAFKSSSRSTLGHPIPLASVKEWADLEERIAFPLMLRPAFGYYRNPIANTIDGSFCGVSIFDCAEKLIKQTDIQFGRLNWEFESGERAIHVDDIVLSLDSRKGGMSRLSKRLYRGLNTQLKAGEDLFKEFSPALREQAIINGLEEYKRNIEFAVGLSYGDISNPQAVEKTATEIKSAKKRKYNTVTAIQNNLQECLSDLCYALAFYNELATSGYEFNCDFKDSILTDEETERRQDKEDLAMGIMRPEEYRAKWYNESIEEAAKKLPQGAEVLE